MFVREFECPSCGGRIEKRNVNSKSVACPYCGQASHIQADSLAAAGQAHLLVDYGSILSTGLRGQLGDQKFEVHGRMRIEYEDGFWDEWYIRLEDGRDAWIQEDDGSFVLFLRQETEELPTDVFEKFKVGSIRRFSSEYPDVFVSSRARAKVLGADGELPFVIKPGDSADFVEGMFDGKLITLELLPEETILFVGQHYEVDDFIL
ncbi:MAG: DUF4178 domain-containing protein [Saprospiraceae bacterium]